MIFSRLLVTGGAGFIGSNFIRYISAKYPNTFILNLDLLTYAGSLENLKDLANDTNYLFVQGNICDQGLVISLLQEHNIDSIIHFAAETHVDRSITSPSAFINTNIQGTFSLLEGARIVWSKDNLFRDNKVRFHHISTDEVFGSLMPKEPAFTEETPYAPNSPYAASKASSDHIVRSYYHTYGLPVTLTNCSNNYGPYQFPEKLIPLMVLNMLEGKPLPIYGDGMQIRDWLYVEDHCEAIWKVLQNGKVGSSYNVGGNNQPANLEIVDSICALIDELQPDSPYKPHSHLKKFVTDRPGHDRRYAMNISKIQHELGWQPKHDLSMGLRKTIEWYLANPEWIASIRSQKQYNQWVDQNYTKRGEK